LGVGYSAVGVGITFQVMAVTLQSTGYHDAIDSFFKGLQDHEHI